MTAHHHMQAMEAAYGASYTSGNALIGLLVGLFLLFITYMGIVQLMDIQTSDRLGAKDPRESK